MNLTSFWHGVRPHYRDADYHDWLQFERARKRAMKEDREYYVYDTYKHGKAFSFSEPAGEFYWIAKPDGSFVLVER